MTRVGWTTGPGGVEVGSDMRETRNYGGGVRERSRRRVWSVGAAWLESGKEGERKGRERGGEGERAWR